MTFEGVTFVEAFWKGKKEADFIKHENHHGLTTDQLKEAWKIIEAKNNTTNQSLNSGMADKKAV